MAVIANAVDADSKQIRQAKVEGELAALSDLGLRPEELDLRTYFDRPGAIGPHLARYGQVCLRGGNVFVLR